ncbi:MAG TPA: hypothetical protein PLO37_24430 [Candidatus Hydrogenedentes bacterium]|nr:hypothetical protein [Candidatus Hydrogenedentota bacterium]HPG70008.1 hypothetical protein [Candidatus Hydrogenedentota bacterium]
MGSLIESIVSLEKEARDVVERARREAERLDSEAHAQIASARSEIAAQVDARIASARGDIEKKHRGDMAEADRAAQAALEAIERIPQSVIESQSARIVERFLRS